jgi:hypothetical protein
MHAIHFCVLEMQYCVSAVQLCVTVVHFFVPAVQFFVPAVQFSGHEGQSGWPQVQLSCPRSLYLLPQTENITLASRCERPRDNRRGQGIEKPVIPRELQATEG